MSTSEVNICFLKGPFFWRKKTKENIINSIKSKNKNIDVIYVDSLSYPNIIWDNMRNIELFNKSFKVILIQEWPKDFEKKLLYEEFVKNYAKISDDSLIIFDNLSIDSKSFLSKIKDKSKSFAEESSINFWEISNFIKKIFKELDKNIDEDISSEIAKVIHINEFSYKYDYDNVYLTCKFIQDFSGRKNVTKETIEKAFAGDTNYLVWNLFDAVDAKDINKSLRILRKILFNADINDFNSILSLLMWRFSIVFWLKEFYQETKNINVSKSVILEKDKLKKEGSFLQQRYLADEDSKKYYSPKVIDKIVNGNKAKSPLLCYNDNVIENVKIQLDEIHLMTKKYNNVNFIQFYLEKLIIETCKK